MHEDISLATTLSRRSFVGGAAGLTFAFTLGAVGRVPDALGATQAAKINAWVTICTDGTVTILCPAAEMGQGVMTSLPLILAEELDADWSKVKAEFAPANPKTYGNPHELFKGAQITAASVSVPGYFTPLRIAGAQARRVLIDSVTNEWKVPASELSTDKGFVVHAKSGRRISYGDVAKFTTVPAELPNITDVDLKKPAQFKLIGRKDIGRIDVPLKVNGSAKYGIDVQIPDMVYASVLEAPAARPRPMTHHVLKAGLDANGNLAGWYHRLVSENVDAVAAPPRFQATGGKDYIGARGLDQAFYGIRNVRAEYVRETRGMRVHAWRGIGSGYNKFAAECFVDEVANAAGKDPLALRLELTKEQPRAQAVIKAVVEMSGFKRKRPGRGMGIAFSDYHGTLSAGVAEVSFDRGTGKIKVHNYWVAVDPGLVIQPDHVHGQLESAVVYGLSAALLEELTVKGGAIQQTNFNDYPVLRMSDLPEIHTKVVTTDNPPTGMGEIGVVAVAPAIANAVFQLTGKRIRNLPMSPDRVKKALA